MTSTPTTTLACNCGLTYKTASALRQHQRSQHLDLDKPILDLVEVEGRSYYARRYTSDEGALKGSCGLEHLPQLEDGPGRMTDLAGTHWLDLGASVGGFAIVAAHHGATVTAVEADARSFDVLERNLELHEAVRGLVDARNLAVDGHTPPGESRQVMLFSNTPGASWRQSIYAKPRKRSIAIEQPTWTVNLEDLLGDHEDVYVKCDVEGAEVDIFEQVSDDALDQIRWCRMEYHFYIQRDLRRYRKIVRRLRKRGFTVEEPAVDTTGDVHEGGATWPKYLTFSR